jgi:hypothetical protein
MPLPKLDSESAKKPLCYNPEKQKFIYYDDIISGKEKIVFPNELSDSEKKLLIIERLKQGPDFTMQAISGKPYNRDDIIRAIQNDEEIGRMTVEAETSMLNDLLRIISDNL